MNRALYFSLVSLAVSSALPVFAADSIAANEDFINAEDYDIDATRALKFTPEKGDPYYALFAIYPNGHTVSLTGSSISVVADATNKKLNGNDLRSYGIYSVNQNDRVQLGNAQSSVSLDVDSKLFAIGIVAANPTHVDLNGKTISIDVASTGSESRGLEISGGAVVNIGSNSTDTLTISSTGNEDSMGLFALTGGQINITAKEFNLSTNGNYGLLAQNNSETETAPETTSRIVINAENTTINSLAKDGAGIMAFSNGYVEINGNLTVNAAHAIDTRGNATININEAGTGKVVLNGDIVFETPGDSKNSGNIIDSNVYINLNGADSSWTGALAKLYPEKHKDQEKYTKVDNFNLTLSNGAAWNATKYKGSTPEGGITEEQVANFVTLNGGVINAAENTSVAVGNLTVTEKGGTFNAPTVKDGSRLSSSSLSVETLNESSSGTLAVNYTGITADDLTEENVATLQAVTGAAASSIETVENVQEGDIRGAWTRNSRDATAAGSFASNTKLDAYSSVNAMGLVQWRNEINHLTKRLGDIRASEGNIGAWARVYGGESQWGGSNEVEMDHTTIQVGGDYRINNHWIAGGAFSYTDSDADFGNGEAEGDSYSLAAYATYMADGGSFLDLIARYGYLKNDITAGNMGLDTSSSAFSLSAEMGHTFRFIEDRAYVEPQFEFTYGFISGDDDTASNGVRIEQDDFQSFVTRVGVRAGYDFPEKKGSFYGMVSYSYDWMGDADGVASQNGISADMNEDLGGGWVTYGIGAQFMMGDSAYFYGELERTSGGDIDNPYLFNVGLRWNF